METMDAIAACLRLALGQVRLLVGFWSQTAELQEAERVAFTRTVQELANRIEDDLAALEGICHGARGKEGGS